MKVNLVEAYTKRLNISESVYKSTHEGEALSDSKKLTIARVLANTSTLLNEQLAKATGTQRADLGEFKKFALDLTTVALPNLIAHDLVIVHPMSSITGFIQYIQFTAGTSKGGVENGQVFNDPFHLAPMDDARVNYTGSFVSEYVELDAEGAGQAAFPPIVPGTLALVGAESGAEIVVVDAAKGLFKVTGAEGRVRIKYVYDNVLVPQPSAIPTLKARMQAITLEAKARRIGIEFAQMAAFQAKQELGIDLGEVLADQACAELSYEIDTEVIKLLDTASGEAQPELVFNKTLPVGVSKAEHYEGFAEVIEEASRVIYDRTQKHAANYMVISSNIKPMLSLMRGWKAASTAKVNGPYFAGTLNGLKVYVTPALAAGRFFLGFNGDDLITSAAVWAPYMAIVPTQLLGFWDGDMRQGFATMYDLKLLNPALLVAGQVVKSLAQSTQNVGIVGSTAEIADNTLSV